MLYQILVIITPLITAPYLTRVLGATNLGIYSYVSSSGSIITTVSLLGIYAYGNRQTAYVRENRYELTKTFWELEVTHCILGALGTAAYIVYVILNWQYATFFAIYYPFILAQFIDCSWVYVGLEDMKPAVMKNFATKLINVIGIFLFVKKREDLWIYIGMLSVTTLLANLSIYTRLSKYIDKPTADFKKIWSHIKGALHLFLPQVASLFYLQVDKVMIKWLTGATDQVSYYDQAEKIITIPLTFITVMSTVMMPRIANEYKKGNQDVIHSLLLDAGRYALLLAFPMSIGLFCIAKQFIPWYLGSEYIPTTMAMRILVPIVVFNSLTGISGAQYFTATDQIRILMKAHVSAAIINIIINAVLIPYYGYAGAAIATVFSSMVSLVIQFYYLNRQLPMGQLLRTGAKYAACSAIMGAAVFLFTHRMNNIWFTTVIQILIGVTVYVLSLIVIRDSTLFGLFILLKSKIQKRTK